MNATAPCPFCLGTNLLQITRCNPGCDGHGALWRSTITCRNNDCRAEGPVSVGETRAEAEAAALAKWSVAVPAAVGAAR